jgi:hypothetical protein
MTGMTAQFQSRKRFQTCQENIKKGEERCEKEEEENYKKGVVMKC